MSRAHSADTPPSPANDLAPAALKPPLKWAGGKRWLVPKLASMWRPHRDFRLVEPFCGGLAVALGLSPRRALLNDVNPHPVNFYRHIQAGLKVRIPMRNESALYYRHRSDFNRLVTGRGLETRKAAELFYYLNRTGYNGLCRFNRKGEFNVPFGHHTRINYTRDFGQYRGLLSTWCFDNVDFEQLPVGSGDFIYADPPYDVPFTQYAKNGFGWSEQERLAVWLSRHNGPVVLSNQATDRVIKLYRRLGFRLAFVDAPRMISCTGDRSPAKEVIASRGL
ncbi:MAG: Dam family site-specific DNA-(adenine-N6)-methyltransferase [Gammaproteobacteria bacterium]|nr:Dam family site-specific DNA-(adenine-N6)-methyltransferase [Gammaproteobacteria bacterium]MDH3412664.1 Dam family site-specific DNA-(adenine-N6)-methyltransferase [Gammaproteobacteria bacterium]